MKKRILAAILCTVMVLGTLAGCGSQGTETNNTETEAPTTEADDTGAAADDTGAETGDTNANAGESSAGGYKIGLSVLNTSGQFFISIIDAAKTEIASSGGELMVNDAQDSAETQLAGIENFIQSGVDGIIVCPVDAEALAPIVAEAKEQGIAIVCLTGAIEGYDAYIGADEYTLGYTQGAAVGKWIAEKWGTDEAIKAATLNYDLMETVIQRKKGIMEGVQEFAPNVEFVADATAADQAEGMTNTENFLQANPDLRVVCGVSDGAALGAFEAFKANQMTDPEQYIIAGVDATDEALKQIAAGTIYQFTVDQNPAGTGAKLVETCIAVIEGGTYEKDYVQDLVAVTPDNISEYVK